MSDALQQLIASFKPEQMELWRAAQPQVQADPVNIQQLDENNMQVDPVLDFSTDENIMNLVHPLLKYGKKYDSSAKHDGLKVHQNEGLCFLMRNVIGALSNGNIVGPGAGAILAHNMGLGKSFTTIAFIHTVLSYFNNVISKVLIIAPQNVTGHWKKEFPKFTITENNRIAEDIRITNFEESGKTLRYNTISNWYKNTREKHIMIMSYDMFKRKAVDFDFHEFLVNPGPDLVIFDEAHKLKNKETQNYKLTVQISTPRKIFLTGTPLQNDPKELYQMINFLHRASVFTINSLNDEFDISISYKLILLIQIIKFCQVGDKLIVFSQSIDTLDYIENLLQRMSQSWNNRARNCPEGETWKWENGKDYMRIDGTTSGRQEIQEIFEETPQIRLMLMSTVASSLGTNFVSANRVVILDSSWNPVHDIQAIYRTYRINQQKDVFVYRLVTKNTIEEWIYNRQVTKESIARRIVDDEDIENIFSQNELENLYKYERIAPYIPGQTIHNYFNDALVDELIKNHPEIIAEKIMTAFLMILMTFLIKRLPDEKQFQHIFTMFFCIQSLYFIYHL